MVGAGDTGRSNDEGYVLLRVVPEVVRINA